MSGSMRDDERVEDHWFYRNRDLDKLADDSKRLREHEILKSRYSQSEQRDSPEQVDEPVVSGPETLEKIASEIVTEHTSIISQLKHENASLRRDILDYWISQLGAIKPLSPGADGRIRAVAENIQLFLDHTGFHELGSGSIGSGMVRKERLSLIRTGLVTLACQAFLYERKKSEHEASSA